MQQFTIDRLTWTRFAQVVKTFATPAIARGGAIPLFSLLVTLLLGINALNVLSSYVGRDFMTAIEHRDTSGFVRFALYSVGVYACLTVVAVLCRFIEERLGLLWRESLTRHFVGLYVDDRTYYNLKGSGSVRNADERIADDVRAFTVTTLSFTVLIINGTLTVLAFSGVLWSISPLLFVAAVLYAAGGSYITVRLGRPLVGLNSTQLDKEANFRSDLIYLRENAEPVALSRREGRLRSRLSNRVGELTENLRRIISVNRNLGFFSTGYFYLSLLIPALFVAPLFMRGDVEFGVITQSSMAFAQLVGAFSLIVTQFQVIASFTAVATRLDALSQAIDHTRSVSPPLLEVVEEAERLAYEKVTLLSPDDGHPLVKDLTISVPPGTRLLILGPNKAAKVALFRATAGIWETGHGRIVRPGFDHIRFLPERPYLYPGTLRELLVRSGDEHVIAEERIVSLLNALGLDGVLARAGGLDVEQDWASILSLDEEQLLAFTRLLLAEPRFAFLDRVCTALKPSQIEEIQRALSAHSITYLAIGEPDDTLEHYDAILRIDGDGGWSWKWVKDGRIVDEVERTA
ncbi:MAG: SbmA/BacA-like family transporter [Methylotetracoccus sp.]